MILYLFMKGGCSMYGYEAKKSRKRNAGQKSDSEKQFDIGSDSLNYIGLNLSNEAGPQIFGSQGSTEAELLRLLELIMTCSAWAEAKNTYLTKFYSMSNYLDNFLRYMIAPPPLKDELRTGLL